MAATFLLACNNKPAQEVSAATTDTAVVSEQPQNDTTKEEAADTLSLSGTASIPAQVFDDITLRPIGGASVVASENSKNIETATTNSNGEYSYRTLVTGKTYTYTCTANGYVKQSQTKAYDGTSSLPAFGLKK